MREVHFVIDEAGAILKGGMPAVEEGLVVGRSYGLRVNLFFQSMEQIKEDFQGKEAIVLGNTEKIFFGTNDLGTAQYESSALGSATITVEDASISTSWQRSGGEMGGGGTASRSASRSWKEQGRELLKPDEVLNLHPDLILAFIRGMRPIMAWRVKWYLDPRFGGEGEKPRFRLPVWWLLMACAGAAIIWALWG